MPVTVKSKWLFQNRMNVAKMGAYYTDLSHCQDIAKMFRFSRTEETCVFEPSIGDASAVKAVTGVANNPNVKIFGVELNDAVAKQTAADTSLECVLQGDTLSDVMITNSAFTFVFGNPPYMEEDALERDQTTGMRTERLERKFLEKVCSYLKAGGICVWVVPHRIFTDSAYLSYWMAHFDTLAVYKFRGAEFQRFKQVVAVGRRRSGNMGVLREKRERYQEELALEKILELPDHFEDAQIIDVPPSSLSTIKCFRAKNFDSAAAINFVGHEAGALTEVFSAVGRLIAIPKGREDRLLTPPIPLKKANRALLVSCGIGAGLAGEDGVDLHLQRGCVTEHQISELSDDGQTEVVKTMAKVNLTIIENDGNIRELA